MSEEKLSAALFGHRELNTPPALIDKAAANFDSLINDQFMFGLHFGLVIVRFSGEIICCNSCIYLKSLEGG